MRGVAGREARLSSASVLSAEGVFWVPCVCTGSTCVRARFSGTLVLQHPPERPGSPRVLMWPVRPHGCRCGICWAARTCFPHPYGCCGRDPAGSWSPVSKASPGGGTWGRGQSGSLVFLSPHQRRQHELQAAGLCPQAPGGSLSAGDGSWWRVRRPEVGRA